MSELKRKILNILAWILFVIGIIMVVWRIFGNSPTDLTVIIPFILFGLIKIWSNNDAIKDVGYQVKVLSMNTKSSFDKVKEDFVKIKENTSRMENKIDNLSNKDRRRRK